jgi:hypothetical protein
MHVITFAAEINLSYLYTAIGECQGSERQLGDST